MSAATELPVLLTAFFAGLLGSGHCFGMCGGIAAGLGGLSAGGATQRTDGRRGGSALLFNLGRLCSYVGLGALSAALMGGVGLALAVPHWGAWLRLVTALMIFLIGLQFLFGWPILDGFERAGAGLWRRVAPLASKAMAVPGGAGRLLLGLCWGLLPCGLVYSVLFTASAAGSAPRGGLVMLAFGVGTLPAMLGLGFAAPALATLLSDRWARKLLGLALVLLAVLNIVLMFARGLPGAGHHASHAGGSHPLAPAATAVVQ